MTSFPTVTPVAAFEQATMWDAALASKGSAIQAAPDALAAYGMQLRAWIEVQVEGMLGPLRSQQELVDAELRASRQAQAELAEAHSSLLAVVEGLSQEISRLRASVSECQVGAQLQSIVQASAARDDSLAAEVARHSKELAGLTPSILALQRDVQDLTSYVKPFEQKVSALQMEAGRWASKEDLELRLQSLQGDGHRRLISSELAPMALPPARLDEHRRDVMRLLQEAEARIGEQVLVVIRARTDDCMQECRQRIQQALSSLEGQAGKQHASAQEKLIADLRAEIAVAFRDEAATVAALDEQIWMTDRRLGQRIEALTDIVKLQGRQQLLPLDGRRGLRDLEDGDSIRSAARRASSLGPPLGMRYLQEAPAVEALANG
mmetsp:Transcript_44354/g.105013  ORF Transcript_44354/g.105013 Transcript_44354/m.105013 type:complete len:378 (+) Transcript_44354:94-1227(+)